MDEEHPSIAALPSDVDLSGRALDVWERPNEYGTGLRRIGRLDQLRPTSQGYRTAIVTWPGDPNETVIVHGERQLIGDRRGQATRADGLMVPIEAPQVGRCGYWLPHDEHPTGRHVGPKEDQLFVCLGGPEAKEGTPEYAEVIRQWLEQLPPGARLIVNGGDTSTLTIVARPTGVGRDWAVTVQTDTSGALIDVTVSNLAAGNQMLCPVWG